MKEFLRRHAKTLIWLLAILSVIPITHLVIGRVARPEPPLVDLPNGDVVRPRTDLRMFGQSWAASVGKLLVVRLMGRPETIGYSHSRLLYDEMVHNEGVLLGRFREQVPSSALRFVLLDMAQIKYRNVDAAMSPERLREIAAGARGFQPDPYADVFPTFQRFVYLNALYDISLSFEHSPLIGCTTFVLGPEATDKRHALLARAFDFEVDEVFDEHKAVFLVLEDGRIPFASVAWPGLVGVVSGMNAEGVAIVVHGARAGEPTSQGEPVVHAIRRVLGIAHTTREAVAALKEREPMVSHIVIITDAAGTGAVVERVPGTLPFLRWLRPKEAITNHFEGIAQDDPKNLKVREQTSTIPRRRRGEQLVGELKPRATVADAVRLLRDRKGVNGTPLELGDRQAIDALIATHGVVMDATERMLWVSESPHLLGRFVGFDLRRLLAADVDPMTALGNLPSIPADPLATSDDYARFRETHRAFGLVHKAP